MANSIAGPVWRIDTVPFSYTGQMKITSANWTDQTSVGDQVVLQTSAGLPIIDSKCQQPNFQQNFGFIGWCNGLSLVTLDSGVLNLAVGAGR